MYINPVNSITALRTEFMPEPCYINRGRNHVQNNISGFQFPNETRNYCIVYESKVDLFVKIDKYALPLISETLQKSNNEAEVTENLYILDRMLDSGCQNIDKMYPVLSRFNNTKSPNIQTFLAGIYRKIQVPDAFGPLVKMLIQNSINPMGSPYFDANEEIGGAILSYLSDRFRK